MGKMQKCSDCKLATQLQNDLTFFFHNSKDLLYEVLSLTTYFKKNVDSKINIWKVICREQGENQGKGSSL